MNYVFIGGSKSGKSKLSEDLALKLCQKDILYIATMKAYDIEDEERIKKHIKRRENLNFITIEKEKNIHELINEINEDDTVLLDSITSLLNNEMFHKNSIVKNASSKIICGINNIMKKAKNVIIVSDYIFNDAITYDEVSEEYKKELSLINMFLVQKCENGFECAFGNMEIHKGGAYEKYI